MIEASVYRVNGVVSDALESGGSVHFTLPIRGPRPAVDEPIIVFDKGGQRAPALVYKLEFLPRRGIVRVVARVQP